MARLAAASFLPQRPCLRPSCRTGCEDFVKRPSHEVLRSGGRAAILRRCSRRGPAQHRQAHRHEAITGRFNEVQEAMKRLKSEIASAKLDVLIIVGDDQHELFQTCTCRRSVSTTARASAMPAGPAPSASAGRRSGTTARRCAAPGRRDIELSLSPASCARAHRGSDRARVRRCGGRGLARQHEGHAYSFVHRWYLKSNGARMLPVVPIFLNTTNPPNPPLPNTLCTARQIAEGADRELS